jgi:hypothetical protein
MDGINPTLAFAALFLGLSGHPRDVAEQPVEPDQTNIRESASPSDLQIGYLFDCPVTAAAVDSQDAPIGPQASDPLEDHRVALASSVLTLGPSAAETSSTPGELNAGILQNQDECGEFAPEPK